MLEWFHLSKCSLDHPTPDRWSFHLHLNPSDRESGSTSMQKKRIGNNHEAIAWSEVSYSLFTYIEIEPCTSSASLSRGALCSGLVTRMVLNVMFGIKHQSANK